MSSTNKFISKVSFFLFYPFLMWSFLGGHKQELFGVNSDHITIAIAALGALIINFTARRFEKVIIFPTVTALIVLSIQAISLIYSLNSNYYGMTVNAIYYLLVLTYASAFKENLGLLTEKILQFSFFAYCIVLVSFLLLGFGEWGRVTIPVFNKGVFSYYPNGYDGSSDANVLAFFFHAGLIVAFWLWSPAKIIYKRIFIALGIISSVLTISRSAALSLVATAIVTWVFVCISRKKIVFSKESVALAVPLAISAVWVIASENIIGDGIKRRLAEASIGSNNDRMSRLHLYSQYISDSSLFEFIFGRGVSASRFGIDPHNFYVSTLYDTGVVSLFLIFGSILLPAIYVIRNASGKIRFFTVSVVVYFLICSLFYWQVRFFYYTLFMVLVVYLYQKRVSKYS